MNATRPVQVLWWSSGEQNYSRDRVVRQRLMARGCQLIDFQPMISRWGHFEAAARRLPAVDLVWVPCFRQNDAQAAAAYAARRGVPLVFDPLISRYDKAVFERQKYAPDSPKARDLLQHESGLFQLADVLVADTHLHASFFSDAFRVPKEKIAVVPVGAEQPLFSPQPIQPPGDRTKVLFYGSFIELQGTQWIVEAARLAPSIDWFMLGEGPQKLACQERGEGINNLHFLNPVRYEMLPEVIRQADILLGIFGTSDKASRVIPNKVYQAMACARPVITRRSEAYPTRIRKGSPAETGMSLVEGGNPEAIARAAMSLATELVHDQSQGLMVRQSYEELFADHVIDASLDRVLDLALKQTAQSTTPQILRKAA